MDGIEKESSLEIKPEHGGRRPGAGRPPGAPNKLNRPIRELAAQYGPDALGTLIEIMHEGQSEQARIMAAKELLDRGYGKPAHEQVPKKNHRECQSVMRTPWDNNEGN